MMNLKAKPLFAAAAALCLALCMGGLLLAGCSNAKGAGSSSSSSSSSSSAADTAADTSADAGEMQLVADGKLTVAASLDFPPFESADSGNKPVGFAVELMDLLADKMGLECEYLPTMKYDSIIGVIQTGGKADVGVSSITITPDREEQVDFTDPYCDSNQGVVVLSSSTAASADDLAGMKIGAQSGTTGYDWALENISGADVIAYDEMTAIFAALQAGQIDGIVADLPVVQYYVGNAYTDCKVIQEIPTGEQYGIAVNKGNPALTEALNAALAEAKSDGSYDALYQKWFGASSN